MASATIQTKRLRTKQAVATLHLDGTTVLSYLTTGPGTIAEAKDKLLETLAKQQAEQLKRRYICCNDGTMLAVYYANGWGYDIIHPDSTRGYCGSTWYSENHVNSFSLAVEKAREHAKQSYDGIKTEH